MQADIRDAIRRARRPLPAREPAGGPYRRWAALTCAAEARHAADDFWACVHRLGLERLFDRDDGLGGHHAPFRLPHEAHAVAALGWLRHLQAHESDRHGQWRCLRWDVWDDARRHDWLRRRRTLWSGFVRQVERYCEARRMIGLALSAKAACLPAANPPWAAKSLPGLGGAGHCRDDEADVLAAAQ